MAEEEEEKDPLKRVRTIIHHTLYAFYYIVLFYCIHHLINILKEMKKAKLKKEQKDNLLKGKSDEKLEVEAENKNPNVNNYKIKLFKLEII